MKNQFIFACAILALICSTRSTLNATTGVEIDCPIMVATSFSKRPADGKSNTYLVIPNKQKGEGSVIQYRVNREGTATSAGPLQWTNLMGGFMPLNSFDQRSYQLTGIIFTRGSTINQGARQGIPVCHYELHFTGMNPVKALLMLTPKTDDMVVSGCKIATQPAKFICTVTKH